MDTEREWYKVTITADVQELSQESAVNSLLLYLKINSPAQIKPYAAIIQDLQATAYDISEKIGQESAVCQEAYTKITPRFQEQKITIEASPDLGGGRKEISYMADMNPDAPESQEDK